MLVIPQIFVQKKTTDNKLGPLKRKKISRIKYLKNQNAIAFCTKDEFIKVKHKLLQPSKTRIKDGKIIYRDYGIPQGSPISSILANMYLINFDRKEL